jgi:glucose-6-phosphate isomerase
VSINSLQQWQALEALADKLRNKHISELFAADPDRGTRMATRFGPFLLDTSRQRWTEEAIARLESLAIELRLRRWIDWLFAGDAVVNDTENQAALHMLLRAPATETARINGANFIPTIERERERMGVMVERLHAGHWRGFSGRRITDLVNIGVGGSDLGPAMVCDALHDFSHPNAAHMRVHFASSMDGSQLNRLLRVLDPETTLFVVSSKSFSTADTLANARTAREWLLAHHADESLLLRQHFVAVTAAPERAKAWGISPENTLLFWKWVGGRYSLWSTIGFPIAVQIGMANFRALLAGAWAMDQHFLTAKFSENLPVLLGFAGVWNASFLGIHAQAILPYDGRLAMFPSYLEQLAMESNGKSVDRSGEPVPYSTCPVLWGGVGPNAQHAFYQLLHQGTVPVTCDFIAPVRRSFPVPNEQARRELASQHKLALANCLGQSRLLAMGDSSEERPAWRQYHGNQPSNTLLIDELTPFSLGGLIALYEHRVFVESVLWNINPFDQWGVELGKQVALQTLAVLDDENAESDDDATRVLIAHMRKVLSGVRS